MRTLAALLLSALLAQGCSEADGSGSGPPSTDHMDRPTPMVPPGKWELTPSGRTWVYTPRWLTLDPALEAAALAEVDNITPSPNTTVHPTVVYHGRGIPYGVPVYLMDPGAYSLFPEQGPAPVGWTGLVVGHVTASFDTIFVAWRADNSDPRHMPALQHELGHILTRDPCAGHGPGGGCP